MLKFHGYFKEGAIVQRSAPVTVAGYAFGTVECTLFGGTYYEKCVVECKDGAFCAHFPASEDTSSVFTLTAVCGGEKISVGLRFGDVYLMAGQSNMSLALDETEDFEPWLADGQIAVLDLCEAPFRTAADILRPVEPLTDFPREYEWKSGEQMRHLSALSVMTAALISRARSVPVGAVHTALGGLGVEAYLKRETAERDGELIEFLKSAGRYQTKEQYNHAGERNYSQIAGVWNEKIAPLADFRFAGIVWYLGESSAWDLAYAQAFLRAMHMVVGDMKKLFGDIPFIAVQIAPEYYAYGDGYGYLYINETLSELEKLEKNVTAVPIYDIEPRWFKEDWAPDCHPIHPVNKAPIAKRIAEALQGEKFPSVSSVRFEGERAVCKIANAGEGLCGGEKFGFTLAAEEGKYYPATAKVIGPDEIEVRSQDVSAPRRLTYAFQQYQDFCNVFRKDGAPFAPYRTERGAVHDGYCFLPAFLTPGAAEVYENCYGSQAGYCHKVRVWRHGEIYDADEMEIAVTEDGVLCRADPSPAHHYFFSLAPAFNLMGHHNHVADYDYWNFTLSSDAEAEFIGVVLRAAGGNTYRFELLCGERSAESVPIDRSPKKLAVALSRGKTAYNSPMEFSRELRREFIQAEFVFRAKQRVTVKLSGLELSDTNRSEESAPVGEKATEGVTLLPQTP